MKKLFTVVFSLLASFAFAQEWYGTGFALNNGYVVTNYHVTKGASSIKVRGVKGDFTKTYTAVVIKEDKVNDLALIKINDASFTGFGTVPYRFRNNPCDVAEYIFVLGYPKMQILGDEIKFTEGSISALSGFQGDITTYQISASVTNGNSGGPAFDKYGNLIGIVSSGITDKSVAENVGYAIKVPYLKTLIESAGVTSAIPTQSSVANLSKTERVKRIKKFVFMIECNGTTSEAKNSPSYTPIVKDGYVDLGLSVLWADRNIGASSPSGYGNYYAWGETSTKPSYTTNNSITYGRTKTQLTNQGIINSSGNLTPMYDAAKKFGKGRMPTFFEIKELMYGCSWIWTTMNGVNGYKVVGKNGNSIFLPAAGYRDDYGSKNYNDAIGRKGYYYTSSVGLIGKNEVYSSWMLNFDSETKYFGDMCCSFGCSIRPVMDLPPIPIENISLNHQTYSLYIGEQFDLKALLLPTNARDYSVTFSAQEKDGLELSSSGNNCKIKALRKGVYTVTATTNNRKTAQCRITVKEKDITSISLNKNSLSLNVGDKDEIAPSIAPTIGTNKEVRFSSSDSTIASVSASGVIFAKQKGKAIITATTVNGKTATCVVTVNVIDVATISLNLPSYTLEMGEMFSLKATVLPSNATDKTVKYSSSNPAVATVNNGVVRSKSVGTATITATASNGKTAQCVVTVKEKQVKSIVLNKTSQTIWPGGTFVLDAKVSPYDAANKTVAFRSSNESVASVNSKGVVKAKSNGTATITATTSNGKSASCVVTVSNISMVNIGGTVSGATLWQPDESLLFYYTLDRFSDVSFYKSVDGGKWILIEKGVTGAGKNIRKGRRSLVYTANNITPGKVKFAIVGERVKSCMLSLGGFYSFNNYGGVAIQFGFRNFYVAAKSNLNFTVDDNIYTGDIEKDFFDVGTGKNTRYSCTMGINWLWRKRFSFYTGIGYGERSFSVEQRGERVKIAENSIKGVELESGLHWWFSKPVGLSLGYSVLGFAYSDITAGLTFRF